MAMAAACGSPSVEVQAPTRTFAPIQETEASGGDTGDPALWVNEADPGGSLVIGTDKTRGLAVYDVQGRLVSFAPGGTPNNVDIRSEVLVGGQPTAVVVAGDDRERSLLVYRLDTGTGSLAPLTGAPLPVEVRPHGSCLYRSSRTGRLFAFAAGQDGLAEQWELSGSDAGTMTARRVRGPWDVGGRVDGCVADDELGRLYLAEEDVGIWQYGAEPEDSTTSRRLVDGTGGGRLVADVEGLGILIGENGRGFLMASSQGDSTFVVYRREDENAFVLKFAVPDGIDVDGCDETDGLEVTGRSLGPGLPDGALVCQDAMNDGSSSNFKLVPLDGLPPWWE